MASREKRPLAPSKSKQKANNDSVLPPPTTTTTAAAAAAAATATTQNNRKRSQTTNKQQQLAREILEVVASGSQLSTKLEASLPRKKVLRNLRRKQKLRNSKGSLINVKVTKKVPIKNLRRISVDVKKGVKLKKVKRLVEAEGRESSIVDVQRCENEEDDTENETSGKRNNSRAKKTKPVGGRSSEDIEVSPANERETIGEIVVAANPKSSPKTARKLKISESPESPSKNSSKSAKSTNPTVRRNASKERDALVKSTTTTTSFKSNNSVAAIASLFDGKNLKKLPIANSSVDLTIEEVVASMLSDTEAEDCQVIGGKVTRSRKMLVDDKILTDVEIKKEIIDNEEMRSMSEDDCQPPHHAQDSQSSIQLRNRASNFAQRSLRNGKLRQLTDSGISLDSDMVKKRRWLNMDESTTTTTTTTTTDAGETSVDNASDGTIDAESSFSESSANDNQSSSAASSKDEISPIKLDSPTDFDDGVIDANSLELENNNNSERIDQISGEVGPILRSKTKAKSTEMEIKLDESEESEEPTRPIGRSSIGNSLAGQLDPRKSGSLEQLRKDNLTKIIDGKSPKSRRSSLNIDVKKTMSSFYNEKTDNSSKSHIDQMIENIKLTIAKSIESKIFGPEKSLARGKNFEVPKIEEIVAPLSAESQKLGGLEDVVVVVDDDDDDDDDDEDGKQKPSKSDVAASDSSVADNSVPKVADTAKEIEKLVMGDMENLENETHNSESASVETPRLEQRVDRRSDDDDNSDLRDAESAREDKTNDSRNIADDDEDGDEGGSVIDKLPDESDDSENNDSAKDSRSSIVTRKSLRRKNSPVADLDNCAKSSADDGETSNLDEDSPEKDATSFRVAPTAETATEDHGTLERTNESVSENSTVEFSVETNNDASVDKRIDSNDSSVTEDAETLESITKEVERLVSEASTTERERRDAKKRESPEIAENAMGINVPSESVDVKIAETIERAESPATNDKKVDSCLSSSDRETNAAKDVESLDDEVNKLGDGPGDSQETSSFDENAEKTSTKDSACNREEALESRCDAGKVRTEKTLEEQKFAAEENRRVLRARDKLKKAEANGRQSSRGAENTETTVKIEIDAARESEETHDSSSEERVFIDEKPTSHTEMSEVGDATIKSEESEVPARTRRSREVKRRKDEPSMTQNSLKNKRCRKDGMRKSDQRNKEETLLDNEVATINENNRSLVDKYDKVHGAKDNLRGFSEGGRGGPADKHQDNSESNRSKSENDIESVKSKSECDERLSRQRAESDHLKDNDNDGGSDVESKMAKTPETPQKDSDEASTSGESSSSLALSSKIDETPEDKAKKESILRLLGLESLEKAAERLNHQKARKEQYTGTLKTVIRVQKDKDKKRSRSPLKMVLKQGRGDGDGDSPEFYTIQKEFGTSGLGDSSSGANRKFSTNHRHSCDEDNEEAPPKDRQSLVIPEKSSSFSIHPGRLCADVCCYCFGKFGSLDTPMHLAQMKSDERRQKILGVEKHLNKDSCLCDACYRHVDRRANTSPTNMQTKPQRQHRQLMVSKCLARDCREPARHHIKRRWLLKVKTAIQHQVDINWETSQHTSMSFCVDHYSKIEPYLTCALCKRRLAKNHTHPLAASETEELNQRLGRQGIPVHLVAGTFVCKLCRYFTQLQLKYKYAENMNASHRTFCKTYRIRILHCHDIEVFEAEEDDATASTSKDKEKRKKAKCGTNKSAIMSKSPDGTNNSASEKSTPEPTRKNSESFNSEADNENRGAIANDEAMTRDVQQLMDLESTVEKLKKRKALEQLVYTTTTTTSTVEASNPSESRSSSSDVVEILAMDKEVTLTRLPKRPRVSNDITPVVQRLGANPSISVRTLFPGEEEMNLHANVEFANVREITPQGWEKCATMIQYDRETKILWQELQRPYGNQSSFLRHLILLEKYYRSGDLVLAPNASRNAINYSTSVQNRLISYEGPEKMDEPIMEPISSEYNNSRRLSGGYMMERGERLSLPGTSSNNSLLNSSSSSKPHNATSGGGGTAPATPNASSESFARSRKLAPPAPRVLKLTSGVSIIKKPPPSLQRLSLPSGGGGTSSLGSNGSAAKRRDSSHGNKIPVTSGGKVFQLSEAEFRRLQSLKMQKQLLSEQKQSSSPSSGGSSPNSNTTINLKSSPVSSQYQKAQMAAQTQFQKHLRMQQEMLNRQSRGDFEPLICDVRSLVNENTPTQNLINTLNLPKSIQVTTKPSNPIPILPKIPKSLTVIPQTISRPLDK